MSLFREIYFSCVASDQRTKLDNSSSFSKSGAVIEML